jgi:hypothetical protein
MELIKLQPNPDISIKRASTCLPFCIGLLFISSWFAPYSITYLLGTALIGLIFTVLAIIYWKRTSSVWFVFNIILITQGEKIIRSFSFTEPSISKVGWMLPVQHLSLVFTVFFVGLIVFRARIKQYLLADSEGGQKVGV